MSAKTAKVASVSSQLEEAKIKVIGVGGGGCNAVEHMVLSGLEGVQFIVANTDAQALDRSSASVKIRLGTTGLGAGARPEKGQEAAIACRAEIEAALEGANMVFVTAGMGGGTGTGAAPVVAGIAREMGILTVGVVTKPFTLEGMKRRRTAESGIVELQKNVDSLIVVLNDRLMDVLGADASLADCFGAADDVLRNAVGGIAEIITFPGLVNVDFEDIRTVMSAMGRAMMGSAAASGPERASLAAQHAIASPLLEGINLNGAGGIVVNISARRETLLTREVTEVMNVIGHFASEDAHVIVGAVYDDSLEDELRVTVIATGLGGATASEPIIEMGEQQLRPAGIQPSGVRTRGFSAPPGNHQPAVFRTRGSVGGPQSVDFETPAYLRRPAS